MDEPLQMVTIWREIGRKVAVATVVATRKSAPRPVGSAGLAGPVPYELVREHARDVVPPDANDLHVSILTI